MDFYRINAALIGLFWSFGAFWGFTKHHGLWPSAWYQLSLVHLLLWGILTTHAFVAGLPRRSLFSKSAAFIFFSSPVAFYAVILFSNSLVAVTMLRTDQALAKIEATYSELPTPTTPQLKEIHRKLRESAPPEKVSGLRFQTRYKAAEALLTLVGCTSVFLIACVIGLLRRKKDPDEPPPLITN